MVLQMKKEYGGYLPLELLINHKNRVGYYDSYNIKSFNTIKASIPLIKEKLNVEEIYVPHFLCPNVIIEIKRNFNKVVFYNLNKKLLPCLEELNNKVIYIVNYFGILDKKIKRLVKKHQKTIFIIDNAHSFFCKPILRDNVYNLYSCKKFFGVPDGGYLITLADIYSPYQKSFSSSISSYLIQSLEEGTNSCYNEKKRVDNIINNNYSGISFFSEKILSLIDYKKIIKIRRRNFKIYNKEFKSKNIIQCEKRSIPYVYPLNVGKNIKDELIRKLIYVPTLWNMDTNEKEIEFELFIKDKTLFLPLDQRYDKSDIVYIINVVNNLLEEYK